MPCPLKQQCSVDHKNLMCIQGVSKITSMVPMDDLSGEWGEIRSLFCFFMYAHHWQPIRVCSHLLSSPNERKELNNQRETFPSVEEISTLLSPPLEGEIQPTQGKVFILIASSLTEGIKKVQSWTSYRKLYRMVHNSKNLWRDQKTFSCCSSKKGSCKTQNRTCNL